MVELKTKARSGNRGTSAPAASDGGRKATKPSAPKCRKRAPSRLTANYQPSPDEPFMNTVMKAYFRHKILRWREELMAETTETLESLQRNALSAADLADRASMEAERALELRTRDRERKLVQKIDAALKRIATDAFGYCEMTGEPISLKRLEARPIATLSIEAQELHERLEKTHRGD